MSNCSTIILTNAVLHKRAFAIQRGQWSSNINRRLDLPVFGMRFIRVFSSRHIVSFLIIANTAIIIKHDSLNAQIGIFHTNFGTQLPH